MIGGAALQIQTWWKWKELPANREIHVWDKQIISVYTRKYITMKKTPKPSSFKILLTLCYWILLSRCFFAMFFFHFSLFYWNAFNMGSSPFWGSMFPSPSHWLWKINISSYINQASYLTKCKTWRESEHFLVIIKFTCDVKSAISVRESTGVT